MGNEKKKTGKKFYLLTGLGTHLSLLIFFKFWSFDEISALPLGISFYTFQALSYLIDIYSGELKPCRSFWNFTVFKLYFPQLIAGPIERASHLLPQVEKPRKITWESVEYGIYLFMCGLFKKIVIADNVAPIANRVFLKYETLPAADIWMGAVAFTIQIYADFSGYTDMARGLAKMMGFDLVINFRMPLLATNPADFWRRWHISLSNWFRDYIYYPAYNKWRNLYVAVLIAFLLNGIWHGTGWNFVVLGLYWGILVSLYSFFQPQIAKVTVRRTEFGRIAVHALSVLVMFQVICFGFLIFRAESGKALGEMVHRLATTPWTMTSLIWEINPGRLLVYLVALITLDLVQNYSKGMSESLSTRPRLRFAAMTTGIYLFFLIYVFTGNKIMPATEFIYFQF